MLLGLLSLVPDLQEVRTAGGLGRSEGEFRQQVRVVAISALWLLGFSSTLICTTAIVATLYLLVRFAELMPPGGVVPLIDAVR